MRIPLLSVLFVLSSFLLSVYAEEEPEAKITARTWIYDDTQVFFTIMVYFPFVANFFESDVSLKRSNGAAPESRSAPSTDERVVIPEKVEESDGVSESDTASSSYQNISLQSDQTSDAVIHSRQRRFLFAQDEQPINVFLCVSLPFSVPILQYDDRLEKKYKDRKSRHKMSQKLPLIQPSEDDFVEPDPDDEDSDDFYEEDGYDPEDDEDLA